MGWIRPLCFAALACVSGAANAGAYMRSEGELLVDLRADYAQADRAVTSSATSTAQPCVQQHRSLTGALDYGFSYYLTGYARAGAASTQCGDNRRTGPGDLMVGTRGRLDFFANNRSWEVEAYVPARALGGEPGLGCAAYGGAVHLEARDEIVTQGFIDYGAGYVYWADPLVPQAIALLGYSAPLNRANLQARWDWSVMFNGTFPLQGASDATAVNATGQGPGTQQDCGTHQQVVRGSIDLSYRVGLNSRLGCGFSSPLLGGTTQLTRGAYCAYQVRWE